MKLRTVLIFLLTASISFSSSASIVVGGTRVVFDGSHSAVSLSVENKDKVTNLVQSWLSPAEGSSLKKESMIITPPLFRLESGKKASIRIASTGMPMPEDRETLLWLNVKGIPASEGIPDANTMQIAINSKIKLIYRPARLKGQLPEQSAHQLSWEKAGQTLRVKNPTPFYMNFSSIDVNGAKLNAQYYISPFSTIAIPVSGLSEHGKVVWSLISDYGMKEQDNVSHY